MIFSRQSLNINYFIILAINNSGAINFSSNFFKFSDKTLKTMKIFVTCSSQSPIYNLFFIYIFLRIVKGAKFLKDDKQTMADIGVKDGDKFKLIVIGFTHFIPTSRYLKLILTKNNLPLHFLYL